MPALAALFIGLTQFGGSSLLQPRTYGSPSGEWTLAVDPSTRSGDAPAHYSLKRKGLDVWSGDRPFALWDVQVTDDGVSAGYSYSAGIRAFRGSVHIAILSPSGEVVLDEAHERKGSRGPEGAPNPRIKGLCMQPRLHRLIVEVTDDIAFLDDEEWWMYDLTDGHALDRVRPRGLHVTQADAKDAAELAGWQGPLLWSLDTQSIAGTPLTLVQWCTIIKSRTGTPLLGTRFVVCDANLVPVWMLDSCSGLAWTSCGDSEQERVRERWERSCVLSTREPHRFELSMIADAARVTFEVKAEPSAEHGWSVVEVERAAYSAATPKIAAEIATIQLAELASVPLGGDAHELREPANVRIDSLGRVAVEEASAKTLHLFDANGVFLHTCAPNPTDYLTRQRICSLAPRSDGELYLQFDDYKDRFVEFDPNGGRVATGPLGGNHVAFRPGKSERWAAFDDFKVVEMRRIDFEGKLIQRITRRPDSQWFRQINAVGIAKDGGLAILDASEGFGWGGHFDVCLFDSAGEPERVIEVPSERVEFVRDVARSQRWIIASNYLPEAWLISLPDGLIRRVRAPHADDNKSSRAFALSPDETELWCAQAQPPMLHRFALPK